MWRTPCTIQIMCPRCFFTQFKPAFYSHFYPGSIFISSFLLSTHSTNTINSDSPFSPCLYVHSHYPHCLGLESPLYINIKLFVKATSRNFLPPRENSPSLSKSYLLFKANLAATIISHSFSECSYSKCFQNSPWFVILSMVIQHHID